MLRQTDTGGWRLMGMRALVHKFFAELEDNAHMPTIKGQTTAEVTLTVQQPPPRSAGAPTPPNNPPPPRAAPPPPPGAPNRTPPHPLPGKTTR